MKKYLLPVIACLGLAVLSCSEDNVVVPENPVDNKDDNFTINPDDYPKTIDFLYFFADDKEKEHISAISGLTLILAENMDELGSGQDNLTFSPITEALNLIIVANAADAEYQERVSALTGGYDFDEITETASKIAGVLPCNQNGAFLTLASSMWINKPRSFSDDYMKKMEELFGATSGSLDFSDPASADIINSWCKEKTYGIIDEIMTSGELKEQHVVWLTSLYFMGEWSEKFDRDLTHEADFHTPTGDVKVQMMHTDLAPDGDYELIDGYECASISFAAKCEFKIVLPPADMPLEHAVAGMPAKVKEFIMSTGGGIDRLHLDMPRFSCANRLYFMDLYKKLGIALEGVSFPVICGDRVVESGTMQNASISIDEDGAKGGAVSATFIVYATAESQPRDIYLTLDRPFFYYITNRTTGAIIFAGRISNP